jgi:hypothetical protein
VVFDALTQRDGQLRSLIQNANRVFATTAARNKDLQAAFVALPTFERESRTTLVRLTQFAHNTNPLVTQLRPAARQLSPTLQQVELIAPDLKTLFTQLNPLITASKAGFPAAQQVLEDARPLLAQLDPATRQLTPILDFIGMYKPELTAFFANTVAASEAKDPSTNLHYLRTMNPLNLENLAVYPKRLGTNRTNAYAKPGIFNQLQKGLPSFETRHCGRPVPGISNTLPPGVGPSTPGLPVPIPPGLTTDQVNQIFQTLVPQSLLDNLQKYVVGPTSNSKTAAPPCVWQGKYTFGGETTQYPHVRAK